MSATTTDRRPDAETLGASEERIDPQSVLAALEDEACRAILGATAEEALTALELAEECDVPTSTTYRKVEQLAEAELLFERVRINDAGKNATEYRAAVEGVTVAVDGDGGIDLEVTRPEPAANPPALARGFGD